MRNYLLPLLILLCTAAYGQNNDSLSVCKDTLSATRGQTSADSDSVAMGKNLLSDSMVEKRGAGQNRTKQAFPDDLHRSAADRRRTDRDARR